jgi:DNA replication protein DnaC
MTSSANPLEELVARAKGGDPAALDRLLAEHLLFVKAQDLFDEMFASLADRATPRLVRQLSRIDVLAIDEMGYLTIRPEQANVFFRLMEERYSRKPTIITTNLAYDEWHRQLGNQGMVDALLSRLRHRCHTVTIDGPSLREPQAKGGKAKK